MLKLLLIAAVISVVAANKNEETEHQSQTYLRPEYLKPYAPFYPRHHKIEHEVGRYHFNFIGHQNEDYGIHYGQYKTYNSHPYINNKYDYGHVGHKPSYNLYYSPHQTPHLALSPLSHSRNHGYGYLPSKEAYHNVSPFVERKIDRYAYDHGNAYNFPHEKSFGFNYDTSYDSRYGPSYAKIKYAY